MTCDHFRELLSARLDEELPADDAHLLSTHLTTCARCRAHETELDTLRRSFRLNAAEQLSELSERSAGPIATPSLAGSLRAVSALRWLLFVVGGTLIVLNLSNLLFDVEAVDRHLSRHDGVFGTALGIGMLSVAFRPQRAIGLVPLTSTIAALMAVVAISDVVGAQRTMLAEAVHLLEFVGLICLWVISGGVARLQRRLASVLERPTASTVPQWPTA